MKRPEWLEHLALGTLDTLLGVLPQKQPTPEVLQRARLIAHRGHHRNGAKENTLEAFRQARTIGCWGIEFDVRWTRDGVPVVHHDIHTGRVFGSIHLIEDLTAHELKHRYPEIPLLEELVSEFGFNQHLLIEIKCLPRAQTWSTTLKGILKNFEPGEHFHVIGLEPQILEEIAIIPRNACLPIAQIDARRIQSHVEALGFGGMLAPHAFCPTNVIAHERKQNRIIGTGFVDSPNILRRELNRGVEWLFTNNPEPMAEFLARLRLA